MGAMDEAAGPETRPEDVRILRRIEQLTERIADLEERRSIWAIAQDVAESGIVDDIDERLRYVVVQVDRKLWRELRRVCWLSDNTKPDLPW